MLTRSTYAALVFACGALYASGTRAAEGDPSPSPSSEAAQSETNVTTDASTAASTAGSPSATRNVSTPAAQAVVAPVVEARGPTAEAAANEMAELAADSFSNDSAGEAEQQHRIDLYGFADLTYTRLLVPRSSPWARFYTTGQNSFAVGNFNLYLSSNLGDNWRALSEVRFMYLPNGSTTTDTATGQVVRTDTTALDYSAFGQPLHWGAIRIERVYVEHEFSSLFKLQAGAFLTPYGVWNVDHGSPAIIGIRAPIALTSEFFPSHQIGLQLYGNRFFEPFEVGYHLTLSNGRGPVEYENFGDDMAVGGRVYLKSDAFGSFTVGTSAYRGGYYDRSARWVVQSDGAVDQAYTTQSKFEEFSFGTDLKWQWKQLLVQSEFLMNEVAFEKGGRPLLASAKPPVGFQADYRRWGGYGLVGYRTHLLQTMPYVIVQYLHATNDPIVPPAYGAQFGLNIRPTPAVVLKVEVTLTHFTTPGSIGLGLHPLNLIASQVAWAF